MPVAGEAATSASGSNPWNRPALCCLHCPFPGLTADPVPSGPQACRTRLSASRLWPGAGTNQKAPRHAPVPAQLQGPGGVPRATPTHPCLCTQQAGLCSPGSSSRGTARVPAGAETSSLPCLWAPMSSWVLSSWPCPQGWPPAAPPSLTLPSADERLVSHSCSHISSGHHSPSQTLKQLLAASSLALTWPHPRAAALPRRAPPSAAPGDSPFLLIFREPLLLKSLLLVLALWQVPSHLAPWDECPCLPTRVP